MKKLLVVLGVLAALVVVGFFVVTSSGFLKSVILPRVGAALNAQVEAQRIALSPFSSVTIEGLKVTPNGAEPLVTAQRARVAYQLGAILGGNIVLDEVHLVAPQVTVIAKADGSSNLDPILRKLSEGGGGGSSPAPSSSAPPQVDIRSIRIENGLLSYRASGPQGASTAAEIAGLGLTVTGIRNGGTGRIEVNSGVRLDQRADGTAAPATAGGNLKGGFDLALTPDLMPATVKGRADFQVETATGALQELQGMLTTLQADLTPTQLNRLALEFQRAGTPLGAVAVSGPMNAATKEAKLQVEVRALDRNVLNLAGAPMGLDFLTSRFDSTNVVEISSGGAKVAIQGSVTGSKVAVKKGDLTMPPVDLRQTHELAIDVAGQAATLRAFALSGAQGGREILQGTLSQPLQVSWATNAAAVPDAAVRLAVKDLRLADWSALAGAPVQGTLTAAADLGVRGGGKDLTIDASAVAAGLAGTFGSNEVRNLGLNATAKILVASFAEPARRRLTAEAEVRDLSGQAAVVNFDRYGMVAKANVELPENAVVIQGIEVALRQGSQPGGSVALKGQWNTQSNAGELQLGVQDVNEIGLRPFLQTALGDKELRTIRAIGAMSLKAEPSGTTAVNADFNVTNLVVRDPSGTVPLAPLAAGLALDASGSSTQLTLRRGELRLTPTARASNRMNLTGALDFSRTNALRGDLKLVSDGVDVTPYFDLFAGQPAPTNQPPAEPAPKPPTSGPAREPDPITLPIEALTLEARIAKFFLREVAAENFLTVVKIGPSRIEVTPMELVLNGAPIKGGVDLNLGVPGYKYDVKLAAQGIPVAPLANSVDPLRKGRIEGAAVAAVDVRGAGVTGVNLKKTLAGGASFAVTNANLKLNDATQRKGILTVLTSLLSSYLNLRELKDQPIMELDAQVKLGDGRIEVTKADARSASLLASVTGAIPIADDLMQSPLDFPVNLALERNVAARARLLPANTPTNQLYVPIPAIASLKGTLGEPKPDVDKVQAGLLAARGVAGAIGGTAGGTVGTVTDLIGNVAAGKSNAVGNLIQGLGGLLGGNTNTTKAATNAPATNAPAKDPIGGLLKNLLDRPKSE